MRTNGLNILGGLVLTLGLGALGCGGTPAADDAAVTGDDTGMGGTDAPAGQLCSNVPTSGFGSIEGRRLEGFTLPQCDNTDYTFYGEDFCSPEHTLTVISIAAEWCGPCQAESAMLTEYISRPYASRGVRLIQIIIQDRDYGPPTLELCDRWVARFNLTDNIELIDPNGTTSGAFPSGSLPSTLIVDETGTIIYREDGASDMLVTLRAELDRALASR